LEIDDVNRDLRYVIRVSTRGGQGSAEVGKGLLRLDGKVARSNDISVGILSGLASNEDQPLSGADGNLRIALRRGQACRI
jgi:hypothetical protein